MNWKPSLAIVALSLMAVLVLPASAVTIPAPTWSWNAASLADGTVGTWGTSANTSAATNVRFIRLTADTTPSIAPDPVPDSVKVSGATNFKQVNAWVNTPSFQLRANRESNGSPTNPDGSLVDSWNDALNSGTNASAQDGTFEMVFRPGDFDGNHTLLNTGGGGAGLAIVLLGDQLEFRFQHANDDTQRVVVDLNGLGDADEFFHVVATADIKPQATGAGALFINGVNVDSAASGGVINDWDGGDVAELGRGRNIPQTTGGTQGKVDGLFTGDVALLNFYRNIAFDQDQVDVAYNRLPEAGSTLALLGLVMAGLAGFRRRRA